ncbi:MAG TPA: DUF929 family protein [Nevskiaceae bacterium]
MTTSCSVPIPARFAPLLACLFGLALMAASAGASAQVPFAPLKDGAAIPQAAIAELSAASLRDMGRAPVPQHDSLKPVPDAPKTTGKPFVLYMGAEFCPYCAAERWPLVMALMRFGKFTDLKATRSSSNDVDPDTATFSFIGSHYQSQWLDFQGVELSDRNQRPLEKPTPFQEQRFRKFNRPPYTQYPGSIPFVDVDDHWIQVGASVSPTLMGGKDWLEIANQLQLGKGPLWQAVLGSADQLTRKLCTLTQGQPEKVCTAVKRQP